jgi:hypothetical protein
MNGLKTLLIDWLEKYKPYCIGFAVGFIVGAILW